METRITCSLTTEPIDVDAAQRIVADPSCGAVCCFVGQTRNTARGRDVSYLEYQAYEPLAASQLQRIAEEAEERWECRAAIQHRLGRVDVGDASIVIAVASPHRDQAFEACRWCIDTVKLTVPIWKREVCPDGTFWIEGDESVPAQEAPNPV